jgi:PAS domain S-box-containing protein
MPIKDFKISDTLLKSLRNDFKIATYQCLNDSEGTLVNISGGSNYLLGYTPKEVINSKGSIAKFVFSEDIEIYNQKLKQFSAYLKSNQEEGLFKIKYRIVGKNKEIKWVEDTSIPVRDELGKITHLEGYLIGITFNGLPKKVSNTLKSFNKAINNASIVSMADKEGKIIYANQNFCKYSKYSLNELIGKNHNIVNSGKHEPVFFMELWKTIKSGQIWRGEICNKAKDGSYYWVDTVITPVIGNNKEIDHYLSIRNIITDKIFYKEQLLNNGEHLKKIIEGVNNVIYTISSNGLFLSLNQTFERITGWKVSEWINKSFIELIHPEDTHIANLSFHKIFAGEKVDPYEIRVKVSSGDYLICEVTPSALKQNGKIVASLGIARDISERKKYENRLRSIYQSVSVKTGTNYFTNVTKYCCSSLGVKYAMICIFNTVSNSIQTLSFRNKDSELEVLNLNIAGTPFEKIIQFEKFIFAENIQQNYPNDFLLNKFNIHSLMGYPLTDEDNRVLGVIVLMNDLPIININEKEESIVFFLDRTANEISRQITENKVKESEEFNRNILSSLTSELCVVNEHGEIVAVNDAWTNFANQNNGNIQKTGVGVNYFDVCERAIARDDDFAKRALKGIKGVLNGSLKMFQMEYPCNAPNEERWFILSVTKLNLNEKKLVLRHINISERKRIEDELLKREVELKKLIVDLTNKNNEMMQFNYIVSHNLRSPIANIIGLSNLLDNKKISNEEKNVIVQHIKDSSVKIDDIVKDLSVVLNTKSNLNTKKEKISIRDILHGIKETLEIQMEKSNGCITVNIDSAANELYSIKAYFESILFNLISNAIKYKSSKRKLLIAFSATKIENKIIIKISDNGIGINLDENGPYVFGLYKRFNFDVEGKGLGLHMTKNQVEALGGTIEILSEPDKGTTFTLIFNIEDEKK